MARFMPRSACESPPPQHTGHAIANAGNAAHTSQAMTARRIIESAHQSGEIGDWVILSGYAAIHQFCRSTAQAPTHADSSTDAAMKKRWKPRSDIERS